MSRKKVYFSGNLEKKATASVRCHLNTLDIKELSYWRNVKNTILPLVIFFLIRAIDFQEEN